MLSAKVNTADIPTKHLATENLLIEVPYEGWDDTGRVLS
jgi:hypothetical protein